MARSKVTIDGKNNNELELKNSTVKESKTSAKKTGVKKTSPVAKNKTTKATTSTKKADEKEPAKTVKSSVTVKVKTTVPTTSTNKTSDESKISNSKKVSSIPKSKTAKKADKTAKGDNELSKTKSTVKKGATSSAKSTVAKKTNKADKSTVKKRTTKKSSDKLSIISLISEKISSKNKRHSKTKTDDNVKMSSKEIDDNVSDIDNEMSEEFVDIPEYYDLPYKYEKTVVKVLYQNPTTLFVYWDISDDDINGFKKAYGDNFFYVTRPVLVIHNITDGYSFEIDINDFANNWYIHVSDAKCKYNVELGRRPSQSAKIENIAEHRMDDFINVSYSNTVEMPNDHILYFKDNDKIYFKNIKTNKVTEKVINLKRDSKGIKSIYDKYNLSDNDDRFDFNNPSSQNPTSNVM